MNRLFGFGLGKCCDCSCCGSFDPLLDLAWAHAGWAEDPLWIAPADGELVTSWRDAIGGTDPAQATVSKQPTFLVEGLSGQPAVRFDGGDVLHVDFANISEPISIVAIFDLESTANNQYILSQTPVDPALYTDLGFWSMNGTHPITGSAPVDTIPHLLVGVSREDLVPGNLYLDGVDVGTNLESGLVSMGDIYLGATSQSNGFMTGRVAFWGIYNGDITTDARWSAFLGWAIEHYGLSGSGVAWMTESNLPWDTETGFDWEMEYA